MNKLKKMLSLTLTLTMLCTTLIGCNSTDSDTGTSTSTSTATTTTESSGTFEVEERVTITYWDTYCTNMLADSYVEQLIESALPIDLVVNRTSHNNFSAVMKLIDERYIPDVMWYNQDSLSLINAGVSRTIPYEMVAEYAPSFLKLYENNPTLHAAIINPDNHDEFLALTGTTDQASRVANSLYADYYRYDWIQELGIDLGVEVTQISDNIYVADNGLTIEKFEEVMHAFTNNDPDGNGFDDTFGASFEVMDRFDLLYSGFGFVNGVNEVEGEAEMYYATDEFKDFVKWFVDLFGKGYIDENFFYQAREERWATIENSTAGYFLESSIALNSWASDRPPLSMAETTPEATFLITPGLSDANGQGTIVKNAMPTQGAFCYISNNVDDEKLAIILQTLEYINFGDEKISMWFGEEGADWQWTDDGKVEEINVLGRAEKGNMILVQNVQTDVLFDAINMQPTFEAGADFWLDDSIWRGNDSEQYQYKLDLQKETNYAQLYSDINPQAIDVMHSYFENWVYNGLDVDESWADYMQALSDIGYNEMMDELNKVEPLETMILDFQ